MVCRNFILPEFCKPCLLLSSFQFAKLIVPYHTSRKATITRWRAEVKPLVSQASEHPETFNPEAFDRELCAIFDKIRLEEQTAERRKRRKDVKK